MAEGHSSIWEKPVCPVNSPAYETASDLFLVTNEKGLIQFASHAAFKMLGYHPDELLGKSFDCIFFDKKGDLSRSGIRAVLKSSDGPISKQALSYYALCKDGREITVEMSLNSAGSVGRQWKAIIRDCSDRIQAQVEIARNEAFLRAMTENSPLAFYVVNHVTNKVLYFNHKFCEIWNLGHLEAKMRAAELSNAEVADACLPSVLDQGFKDHWPLLRDINNRQIVEDEIPFADGRVIRRFSTQIRDDRDGYLGRLYIFEDVTEKRRILDQLKNAKKAAEEGSRVKADFLACMSHEIRTPMNGVLGMVQLLLSTNLDSEQHEFAEAIYESAEGLLSIINDILDFSKLEAGKLGIENVRFNLFEHAHMTAAIVEPQVRDKGLEFDVEITPGTPESVIADPTRLRQIMLNLLGNATKFTHAGKISLRVHATDIGPENAQLRISVQDTGIGIAPDQLKKVFDKFTQADNSTTRKYGGTGLGLSICQQLAQLMGGDVGVESTPDVGSTFWVEVPVHLSSTQAAVGAQYEQPQPVVKNEVVDASGLNILLAEDNMINQKVAEKILQKLGCHADIANDGQEAVQLATRKSYDLILMDCEMPVMNGFEATAEILKVLGKNTPPIVALTAHALEGYAEKCAQAGMSGYITKPLNMKEFMGMIQKHAAGKREIAETTAPKDPGVNVQAKQLLQKFEGDAELVKEIIDMFTEDGPKLLAEVRTAVDNRDAKELARKAHTLKGVVSHFTVEGPFESLRKLELWGRDNSLEEASQEMRTLTGQMRMLSANLASIAMEVVS